VGLAGIPVALAGGALATYTALFLAPVDDEPESAEKAP